MYAPVSIEIEMSYRVSLSTSAFSMSLTSLFDKPDTGAGVILLILLFGALPAIFLTVYLSISNDSIDYANMGLLHCRSDFTSYNKH